MDQVHSGHTSCRRNIKRDARAPTPTDEAASLSVSPSRKRGGYRALRLPQSSSGIVLSQEESPRAKVQQENRVLTHLPQTSVKSKQWYSANLWYRCMLATLGSWFMGAEEEFYAGFSTVYSEETQWLVKKLDLAVLSFAALPALERPGYFCVSVYERLSCKASLLPLCTSSQCLVPLNIRIQNYS